ncbi:hypothetical protein DL762_006372 [Monosporascus cannonballus]|uniref:Uncharacterized protein n=1 Tax=Monosporascus cannonballus TaxID=155416 RepID=A0ABY0H277_9PEZI|nr:hypothetical protein DL762_006372 [Monosporascus cannonballus]
MDWKRTRKDETALAGNFISSEGENIHEGFGGSSRFDRQVARFVPSPSYSNLEQALVSYIPEILSIQFTPTGGALPEKVRQMENLSLRISRMEKAHKDIKQGLWHKMWYGIGRNKESLDAWIDVVPDDYGLALVKAGLAAVFKLAENSVAKREQIYETFMKLQKALTQAHPKKGSFRGYPGVSACADSLYQTVVDSIENMFQALTPKEKSGRMRRLMAKVKGGDEEVVKAPSSEEILQNLEEQTKAFKQAVDDARDQAIEATAATVPAVLAGVESAKKSSETSKNNTEHLRADINRYGRGFEVAYKKIISKIAKDTELTKRNMVEIQNEKRRREEDQLFNRNMLMEILSQSREMSIARKQRVSNAPKRTTAVVGLDHFCYILTLNMSELAAGEAPDLEYMFHHPNRDLELALSETGGVTVAAQGQVQSLLEHDRFLQWLKDHHPGLILVDADVPGAALESLSAISRFCATLVTSIMGVNRDAIVTHFFCGLHTSPDDPWYGPVGLVRSIIMQLITKLMEIDEGMESWDLDFIDDRDYLKSLENHEVESLCAALHSMVSQFQPDTNVYCIIDSIACFDSSRMLEDLRVVMECLGEIIDRRNLRPIFKVLLTNPGTSTLDIKNMPVLRNDPSRLVSLSQHNMVPMEISRQVVDGHLLWAPPPFRRPSPFGNRSGTADRLPFRNPSPALSFMKRREATSVVREVDYYEEEYDGRG